MRIRSLLRSVAALCSALALLLPFPSARAEEDTAPLTAEEREENLRVITAFLREEMALPDAAVAAILANIDRESSFDPRAVDPDGKFFGLCQWSETRWENCRLYCEEHELDRLTVQGQLAFLQYELETEYDWIRLYFLAPAENSEDGAQVAQYYFCQYFEAPLELDWEQVRRSKLLAEVYWPLLTEGGLTSPAATEKRTVWQKIAALPLARVGRGLWLDVVA